MVLATDTSLETAWDRAVTRAMSRGVSVLKIGEERRGFDSTVRYAAASTSQPGTGHTVAVRYSGAGVETWCDCEGAQAGRCCQHAAAALLAEGWLPIRPTPQPAAQSPAVDLEAEAVARRHVYFRAQMAAAKMDPQFG